jgi:hypothetical protein
MGGEVGRGRLPAAAVGDEELQIELVLGGGVRCLGVHWSDRNGRELDLGPF